MSDSSVTPARPVSLFTIVFLLALFAATLLVLRYFYHPVATAAFVAPAENVSKDLSWRSDRDARRKTLRELRQTEAQKSKNYAWIDKNAGTVQLPIERAMELTAHDIAGKQQVRQIRDLPADSKSKF